MRTKHLFALAPIRYKGEVGTNKLSSPVKIFYWPFQGVALFVFFCHVLWFVSVCHAVLSVHCIPVVTCW